MLTSHQPLASKAILYEETALLLHKAGFMWAQSMQLSPCFSLRKSGTEAMCLYSPGDAWRCLWTLSISAVVAVLVFCWPLVDREQGCCRLPPLAEQDPMGPFEFRPVPHDLSSTLVSEKLVSQACSKSQKPGLRINDGKGVNISNKNNT